MTNHEGLFTVDDLDSGPKEGSDRFLVKGNDQSEFDKHSQHYLGELAKLAARHGIETMAGFMVLRNGQICNIFLNGTQPVSAGDIIRYMTDCLIDITKSLAEDERAAEFEKVAPALSDKLVGSPPKEKGE